MAGGEATRLLERLSAGDGDAAAELLPLVYRELWRLADRALADERAGHTLQPTALVNEAWIRLVDGEATPAWESRAHFVRVAARAMRNVLVDHARKRGADKRGGGAGRVALDAVLAAFEERRIDVLELADALEKLARVDPDLARLVELRFFAGLTIADTARVLGVSTPTVERSWRTARMWLRRELADEPDAAAPDAPLDA